MSFTCCNGHSISSSHCLPRGRTLLVRSDSIPDRSAEYLIFLSTLYIHKLFKIILKKLIIGRRALKFAQQPCWVPIQAGNCPALFVLVKLDVYFIGIYMMTLFLPQISQVQSFFLESDFLLLSFNVTCAQIHFWTSCPWHYPLWWWLFNKSDLSWALFA